MLSSLGGGGIARKIADLLLVMQALVIVLQDGRALLLPRVVVAGCVDNVAG